MGVVSRLASNLKLLRRHHHLLKTFYIGSEGWADRQLPDGTVEWTAPTGHTYTTKPGGALFFPVLASPTAELVFSSPISPCQGRSLMMPTRRRTRADDRHVRVAAERRDNEERLAEERRKHAAWLAANYQPPPI